MEENGSKGMAVASLVFGILGMVICCINFPFAIIGLILALVVLTKKKAGKGLAIAGLITSLITLIISTYVVISVLPYKDEMADWFQNANVYIEEYKDYFEQDGAFQRRFDKVIVKEPEVTKLRNIIDASLEYLELTTGINYISFENI